MAAAWTVSAGGRWPSSSGSRASSHWMLMSPRRNSGSAITRRWNSREVSTPSITSSLSARSIRPIAASRVRSNTMSFASIGS